MLPLSKKLAPKLNLQKCDKELSNKNTEKFSSSRDNAGITDSNKKIEGNRKNIKNNSIMSPNLNKTSTIKEVNKEGINLIPFIRKEMKENYLKSNTRKAILFKWKQVVKMLQGTDVKLYLIAMKVLGDIYVEFDDYETARYYYNYYKKISFSLNLLEETIYAYEALGNVSKYLYQYQKAIKCYKKMIELSWILKNENMELRAYDLIGIQYFYLGNKEKARYYHERFIYGLTEKDDSKIKQSVIETFKNKHYHLFKDDAEKTMIKRNLSNEHLSQELIEQIRVYSRRNEEVVLSTYDIFSNQEIMKNSFISDVDMSFQILFDKNNTLGKYYDNQSKNFKRSKYYNMVDFNDGAADSIRENLENTDNLIISHLSSKRKEYNVERFEFLFKRFDSELKNYMNKTKVITAK